ncbi:MAG TPA: hypothetical protein VJ803_09715 [Gemmatimonadaceae bacterium]|nr:hypothetical protein [Gemmatimonadaceae bacterium]
MTRPLLAAAVLVVLGCSSASRREPVMPETTMEWLIVLDSASNAAAVRNFTLADSLLARFAAAHQQAPEAREAHFWRALLKLDAANTGASPADAVAHLDAYLAISAHGPGRREATVLRRLALALDSTSRLVDSARSEVARLNADSTSRQTAREVEMQREIDKLKEQLQQANAELERIKRRLAEPRP